MTGMSRRKKFRSGIVEQLESRRLLAATAHADLVESYSPISYWRLSEPSGSTSIDETGLSPGVYDSGVTLGSSGVSTGDTAADFDGSGDVMEAPHAGDYLLGNGSLSLWFNAESVSGRSGVLSKDAFGFGTGGHFSMMVENGFLRVRNQSTSATREIYSTPLSANTWHHTVVTWGSAGFHVYLDGVLSSSDLSWTNGWSGNLEPVVVGGLQWLSSSTVANRIDNPLDGKIDEVAIFGQVLDAGQVQSLYTSATNPGPTNNAPTALNDSSTTNEDISVTTVNVLLNDTDLDGDTLSVSGFDAVSAQGGSVSSNGDGTFNYTPALNFNGADSFGYTISDGNGGSDSATVNITVVAQNDAPVALDDSFGTVENTPLTTGSVLLNDSDVDGDTLSVSGFATTSTAGGTVSSNGDGTFNYTPPNNFVGNDTFSYTITDGNGGNANALVTVVVTDQPNRPPTALNDSSTTDEDISVTTVNVLLNDTDLDGDTLSVSGFDAVSAQGGSVSSNGDGTFNYTPALNFNGADSFGYTISDGNGGSDSATVNITVVAQNDAPDRHVDDTTLNTVENTPSVTTVQRVY